MNNKEYNYQINGLRFFLISFIVLLHFTSVFFEKSGQPFCDSFIPLFGKYVAANLGSASVCLFFFLSGYFLSIKSSKDFFVKRTFTILIPTSICIVIILIIRLIATPFTIGPLDASMNILVLPLASNLFTFIDGAHWYIAKLLLYYCYFFIIYLTNRLIKKNVTTFSVLFLFLASFILLFVSSNGLAIVSVGKAIFFPCISFLTLGYFANKAHRKEMPFKKNHLNSSMLVILTFLSALVALVKYNWMVMFIYLMMLSVVLLCIYGKLKFLELRFFQLFGTSSLYIYLIHQEIGYIIINYFYNFGLYYVGVIVAIIIIYLVSLLFHWSWNIVFLKKFFSKIL